MNLNPCPFCTNDLVTSQDLKHKISHGYIRYFVKCDRCACRGPQTVREVAAVDEVEAKGAAINLWNRRSKR